MSEGGGRARGSECVSKRAHGVQSSVVFSLTAKLRPSLPQAQISSWLPSRSTASCCRPTPTRPPPRPSPSKTRRQASGSPRAWAGRETGRAGPSLSAAGELPSSPPAPRCATCTSPGTRPLHARLQAPLSWRCTPTATLTRTACWRGSTRAAATSARRWGRGAPCVGGWGEKVVQQATALGLA